MGFHYWQTSANEFANASKIEIGRHPNISTCDFKSRFFCFSLDRNKGPKACHRVKLKMRVLTCSIRRSTPNVAYVCAWLHLPPAHCDQLWQEHPPSNTWHPFKLLQATNETGSLEGRGPITRYPHTPAINHAATQPAVASELAAAAATAAATALEAKPDPFAVDPPHPHPWGICYTAADQTLVSQHWIAPTSLSLAVPSNALVTGRWPPTAPQCRRTSASKAAMNKNNHRSSETRPFKAQNQWHRTSFWSCPRPS